MKLAQLWKDWVGFLLLFLRLFWEAWNAILILRFLPKRVLNLSPTSRFEISALPSPAAHPRKTALC